MKQKTLQFHRRGPRKMCSLINYRFIFITCHVHLRDERIVLNITALTKVAIK